MAIDFPTSPALGTQYSVGSSTWTWSGSYWINSTVNGTQGIQGIQGTPGTQGSTGAGTQGAQGIQGTQGVQGTQGAQGTQGLQGTQGTQGQQGIQGTQGTQGQQGIQGTQGQQGIQGIQGTTGLAFTIAKTYASVAALTADTSPTGIIAGQFALINTSDVQNSENSRLYIWTGSVYTFVDDLSGSAGIQGITGTQGTQGTQGQQGITGSQGTQGIQGTQGAQGLQGAQGTQGQQGIQGIQGILGTQGATGAGTQGTQGIQGIQGITGTQGAQGLQGAQGTQGTQGIQGTAGANNLPPNAQGGSYSLVIGDVGKYINTTTGGVTVPASIFSSGDVVSIFNNSGSNQTITQGSTVTMYLAGSATTGNRTLAQRGVCTVLCVASNTFVIVGSGLS